MRFFCVLIICLLFITACADRDEADFAAQAVDDSEPEVIDPIRLRAAEIVFSMDDQLLVSQLLISSVNGSEKLSDHTVKLLTEIPAGGVILYRFNLDADNDTIRGFISQIASVIGEESGIPPFVTVDHEGGTVNRFRRGVAALPDASSYWRLSLSEGWDYSFEKISADSLRAGREISELGFNMNFAPVAEHLIDENREFLARRSYGPDPIFTARAATAFLQGMEQSGILCVVKNFPGSAGKDPHYFSSVINWNKTELDTLAAPFRTLISNGARAIMVAHTAVPAIDSEVASLSPIVMQNWLRGELGFGGIIISDDFKMVAAGEKSRELAAVRSIVAGTDMVLVWPADLSRTHSAIISGLENGQLSRDRLLDAAQRIIYEKLRMGILE